MWEDDIKSILDKNEYSVDDKIDRLVDFRNKINEVINKEINKLRDMVCYCPYCERSYLKDIWGGTSAVEERDSIEPLSLVIYERPKPIKKKYIIKYKVCPCGHKIEDSRSPLN